MNTVVGKWSPNPHIWQQMQITCMFDVNACVAMTIYSSTFQSKKNVTEIHQNVPVNS